MAQALPVAAAVATVGSSVVSGVSAYKAGKADKRALEQDAKAREREAAVERLRGLEVTADIRENLNSVLSSSAAIAASRNVSALSPSVLAYEREIERDAMTSIFRARAGSYASEAAKLLSAKQSREAKKSAGMVAGLEALSYFAKGGAQLSNALG